MMQVGDTVGQATAQMNISDLRKALGLPEGELSPDSLQLVSSFGNQTSPALRRYRVRRASMHHLDIIKVGNACAALCTPLYNLILYFVKFKFVVFSNTKCVPFN